MEKGTPGCTTADYPGTFSPRASTTSGLFFDGCEVLGDAELPGDRVS